MNVYKSAQHQLVNSMGQAVSEAFKVLLSEKHLYQFVEVNWKSVLACGQQIQEHYESEHRAAGLIPMGAPDAEQIIDVAIENLELFLWVPNPITQTSYTVNTNSMPVGFKLPTINTFCNACKERWPFNPVGEGSFLVQGLGQDESFYLGYECQQCKGEPIRFLLRREGLKIRLAGRYPLEVSPTPKVLPKVVSKYFGNAMIAHHAGQTLAGLFLLRVFIEQFWRTVPAVQKINEAKPRSSGDEQGEAYQSTLPQEFKSRFPSLKEVYGKLSEAIHLANEDSQLFEDSCEKIEEHFDALRLFKITSTGV